MGVRRTALRLDGGDGFYHRCCHGAPGRSGRFVRPERAMTRVLVVEDDARLAVLLERGLERQGHTVDVVGEATTARAVLVDRSYDVIVCDVMLAGRHNGLDLCRQLRDGGIWTPVLML